MNRGKVYSVSSVNQYIKNMFLREYALSVVFVKGEISNCKYHSSGHIYFSIKDEASQLTCVMFRGDRGGLDFRMENGQEVIVGGSISVYERDGKYQLYAKKIVLAGDGILSERYEQLKKKLQEAGYFDIVFMDIQMPVMDGYTAAKEIRSSGRKDSEKIPIVAMTANAFSEDVQKAIHTGMNDHVAKPIDIRLFVKVLTKWLA